MPDKPNVVIIFNDDHAQWASGAYGNRELRTPSIDHLANTGVLMENAFTPTPVCSPSRACFLTGKVASQHGIHDYLTADPEINTHPWLEGQLLLPEILKKYGYQTMLAGKWHLGNDPVPHPAFDEWFSLWGDFPFDHNDNNRYSDNGREVRLPGYTTRVLTDRAAAMLRGRDPDRPFFLMVNFTATHSKWEGHPERLVSEYRSCTFSDIPLDSPYPFGENALESNSVDRRDPREAQAQYYAAVSHLDEAAGLLLDELDGLGLRENTLFIYTSDHGLNCGHHDIWGKGNGTFPLNMVEESIRIPLIFSHPGAIAENHRLEGFVDHTDLFQTVLDYCGVPEQARPENLPGASFLEALQNPASPHPFKTIQYGEYGPLQMARTERYKLILRNGFGEDHLFDLEEDPRETRNIHDEPGLADIRNDLTRKAQSFFQQFSVPGKSGLLGPRLPRCNSTEAWRTAPDHPSG